jgi:glucose-1-phosphate adenylyltransferase
MRNVITLILGGGKGTRLYPLTRYRSKPAVPLAGKYRLIDIPISNCLNSGLNRIYLLTQFNSVSLHRHIRQSYIFDRFAGGFVEILAAQQTNVGSDWYQGTADAVRKNLRYIEQPGIEHVLVLSGDQLYRMDFAEFFKTHREAAADVTIAALPVESSQAKAFGIMRIDDDGRVVGFLEKPQSKDELDIVRTAPDWLDAHGVPSRGRDCLASMGIYLFNRDTLVELLSKSDYPDFGREIFPLAIRTRRVQMHPFDGYWDDIGTIRSFFDCNLALAGANPPFNFQDADAPIYSRARHLPPTRLENVTVRQSLLADGCIVEDGAVIENSVIGIRCRIGRNATIRNSVVMGADFYERPEQLQSAAASGRPPVGIGEGTLIDGAIVDKNCRIGRNVRIQTENREDSADLDADVILRDGVICVQRQAVLPDGWTM